MASPTLGFDDTWFLDIGATRHLSHNQNNFHNVQPYQGDNQVAMDNGKKLTISNIGFKAFHIPHRFFHLQFAFHVPYLAINLISVSKFCYDNHCTLNSIPPSFVSRIISPRKHYYKATLNEGYTSFLFNIQLSHQHPFQIIT